MSANDVERVVINGKFKKIRKYKSKNCHHQEGIQDAPKITEYTTTVFKLQIASREFTHQVNIMFKSVRHNFLSKQNFSDQRIVWLISKLVSLLRELLRTRFTFNATTPSVHFYEKCKTFNKSSTNHILSKIGNDMRHAALAIILLNHSQDDILCRSIQPSSGHA